MRQANELVGGWMRQAGLEPKVDAAFNLLARWPSARRNAKTLLLGSHLDTVRDAGKYDGPLGVLVALSTVQLLQATGVALPFHVEIAGFSDEEGVRYQTAYLGSRALAGTLTRADLARVEEKGIERARRKRGEFLGYAEVHIEQGPVLEQRGLSVGVVSGIAGQSRVRVEFCGTAGHAGTVPMGMRRDALCAAAEFVLAVEKCGVTATVGQIGVEPGASNVIPGRAILTLDVRDPRDTRRRSAVRKLHAAAKTIAKRRKTKLLWALVQETSAVECDPALTRLMQAAAARHEKKVITLPSGAGHDAAAIAAICPVAMLFVPCKGGISHHPDEAVKTADVARAIAVLADFIQSLGAKHG
jgi:allantoate deiminase